MLNVPGWSNAAPPPAPLGNGASLPPNSGLDPALDGKHLKELFRVLRRNWALVFAAVVVMLTIAAYLAFSLPARYQAHAVIRLSDVRRAFTGGFDDYSMDEPLGRTTNLIASELEVLLGRAVLGEVVDSVGLRLVARLRGALPRNLLTGISVAPDAPPGTLHLKFEAGRFAIQTIDSEVPGSYGTPVAVAGVGFTVLAPPQTEATELWIVPRDLAIDELAAALQVAPRGNTNAVSVKYTAGDPYLAQQVVNAAVAVFRDFSARAARQQAARRRQFLEEQLQKNDVQLAALQQQFGAFQAREQVYSSGTRVSAQEQDLLTLGMRREELDADRRMYASLLDALEHSAAEDRAALLRTLISAPGLGSNPVIVQLYTQWSAYEIEGDRLTSGTLGSTAEHPDVQRFRTLSDSAVNRLIAAAHSHVAALDARIAALDDLRARSAEQMRQVPETQAEELRLRQRLATLTNVGDKLAAELQDARMAEAVETGQVEVVYFAPLPFYPTGSGPARKLGAALALGLIFGCAGAFVREILNTSIRHREELEKALGVPGLAVVPQLTRARGLVRPLRHWTARTDAVAGNGSARAAPGLHLSVAAVEAYRMLRSNLVFTREPQPLKRIAVTSAVAGEGKTTTAVNLAVTFAQQGSHVALVDCNLHAPRLHHAFAASLTPGLTELLLDAVPPGEVLQPTTCENLFVITAGTTSRSLAQPINEHHLLELLGQLGQVFDVLILDTAAVLEAADATVIAGMADACILVVRAGATERALAQRAQQQLVLVGARVVGAVLNDPEGRIDDQGVRAEPRARLASGYAAGSIAS